MYYKCTLINMKLFNRVLLSMLFGKYVNELQPRLSHSGYGCKIGQLYYGAVGHAEDVTLVASSIHYMNNMCQIAPEYAKEHNIIFNPSKSQF